MGFECVVVVVVCVCVCVHTCVHACVCVCMYVVMLQVYFQYLKKWATLSSGHVLEEEWRKVKTICTSIRGGEAEASRKFWYVVCACICVCVCGEIVSEGISQQIKGRLLCSLF